MRLPERIALPAAALLGAGLLLAWGANGAGAATSPLRVVSVTGSSAPAASRTPAPVPTPAVTNTRPSTPPIIGSVSVVVSHSATITVTQTTSSTAPYWIGGAIVLVLLIGGIGYAIARSRRSPGDSGSTG